MTLKEYIEHLERLGEKIGFDCEVVNVDIGKWQRGAIHPARVPRIGYIVLNPVTKKERVYLNNSNNMSPNEPSVWIRRVVWVLGLQRKHER